MLHVHVYHKSNLNVYSVESILFVGASVLGMLNFAGLLGRNFMGNWFVALQNRTIHNFVQRSRRHKFVGRSNP